MKYFPYLYLLFLTLLYLACSPLQLWDQDEAAYAGMAKHMLDSGNWAIPEFMWSAVHRKPPLHIWNIAITYKIFGINEFSVRLSSIVFIVLTFWLVYDLTKRLADQRTAAIAMVIASTSLFMPMLARMTVTDGPLLFFNTLCGYALYRQLTAPSWKWILFFWSSFALALLTKGPPIIIFLGGFAILLFIFYPERKKLFSLHPWFFLPLACLPLAWWIYETLKYDNGKFVLWIVDHYIVKRVTGSVFGQTGPPGTHIVLIILAFLPYILFIPRTIKRSWHEFREKKPEVIFLVCWFVAAWFIYEFSPSKLPSYTEAAHIALSILIARYAVASEKQNRYAIILHYLIGTIWILGLVVVPSVLNLPERVKLSFALTGLFIGIYNVFPLFNKELQKEGIKFYCRIGVLMQIAISILILPSIDQMKINTKAVAAYVTTTVPPGTAVLIGNDNGQPPSLPFYLEKSLDKIKAEFYLSEMVAAYYDKKPVVFILKDNQSEALRELIPGIQDTVIATYEMEKLDTFNYHIIKNIVFHKSIDTGAVEIGPPLLPVSYEQYHQSILQSPEWQKQIAIKAKEKNVSVPEMIKMDAKFLYEKDSAIYQYELRMRSSREWLNDLKKKAIAKNISIEEMARKEADYILALRNIQ